LQEQGKLWDGAGAEPLVEEVLAAVAEQPI